MILVNIAPRDVVREPQCWNPCGVGSVHSSMAHVRPANGSGRDGELRKIAEGNIRIVPNKVNGLCMGSNYFPRILRLYFLILPFQSL